MRRTYQAFLLSFDPQKRANCEKKGLITECVENTQKSSFIFKTDFSLREIKLKLGIVSDSDIVEIESVKVKTENNMGDQNRKIKIDIPIIKNESYEKLRTYCDDLKTYKVLMSDWEDKEIIFATLCKSEMTHLRMSMSKKEKEDLNEFISFLLKTYGISENVIWKELRQISQRSDESPLAFWFRLINLYFTARNIEPPNEITDKATQREIQNIFLSGLKNNELKKLVMIKNIDFENLAIETNNISMNLKDLNEVKNSLEIMHIRGGRSPHRSNWRNHSDYRSRSRSKSRERSQDRQRNCYRCGRLGHIRSQCHASSRTVRRYKQFLSSHGKSRSQSRERPSVTFEDEVH